MDLILIRWLSLQITNQRHGVDQIQHPDSKVVLIRLLVPVQEELLLHQDGMISQTRRLAVIVVFHDNRRSRMSRSMNQGRLIKDFDLKAIVEVKALDAVVRVQDFVNNFFRHLALVALAAQ